jgi:predicted RNA-binding protein
MTISHFPGKYFTALEYVKEEIERLREMINFNEKIYSNAQHKLEARNRLEEAIREKIKLYKFVEKLELRKNWTGKTVRAVQQWRPDGDVDRSQMEYNQMRDIFRKFGQSGIMGGGRSRSRSRSRSR